MRPLAADGERLIAQARELILPAENGGGFRHRYYEAMQRDPAIESAERLIAEVYRVKGG